VRHLKIPGATSRLLAILACALAPAINAHGGDSARAQPASAAAPATPTATAAGAAAPADTGAAATDANRFVKDGVVVDFSVASTSQPIREGDLVEVKFRIADATTGEPVRGMPPGAWLDIGEATPAGEQKSCKEKVPLFMRGLVGIRPLVDLQAYYLLVMNQDAAISVVDPIVGMTGKTSLYAIIQLRRPGADWAKSSGDKRIFVSMPAAGQVAVVDGESFKVLANVDAGKEPTRVALQRDARYLWRDGRHLWVGNDVKDAAVSGVTVIDIETLKAVATLPTGAGHHEIAFSVDGRTAFVTNREAGTVSVVDAERFAKVKDVKTGPMPISIASSTLSQSIYVADGKSGKITVLDAAGAIVASIQAKPGLGPLRFSQDGRWGFAVNPGEHAVYVVDAADNRLAHTVPMGGEPYQLALTRAYAYVRLLDSERVKMIAISSLGGNDKPRVHDFPAGARAPKLVSDLAIADGIVQSAGDEAGVYVASPADNSTYYYMEGMNFPMGSFTGYGHNVRAVTVVDRSLREAEPGVYSASVRLPAAGKYDVAFLMESPRIVHCFQMTAAVNERMRKEAGPVDVEYLSAPTALVIGKEAPPFRVRLRDPVSREPKTKLDVRIVYYRVPADARREVAAREVGDGVYEATLALDRPGVYYVHLAVPELGVKAGDLPYRSVRVRGEERARAPAKTAQ